MPNRFQNAMTIVAAMFVAAPVNLAWANQQACSCRNLESIQQELKNAEALLKLQQDMRDKLDAIEAPLIEAKKNPIHPDSDVNIYDRSLRERDKIKADFKLPYENVKDYSGPSNVKMSFGTCEQSVADLEALKSGSQCKELGEINLAHESAHRAECQAAGASEYWKRLPSKMAAEEVVRYTEQVAALRKLLKKVMDEGEVTVEAHLEPRIRGPQFDVTYSYDTAPIKLKGKSKPGSDEWSLSGNGMQVGKIGKMNIAGMTCTSSGQLNTRIDMTMQTDGLTMGLKGKATSAPGDVRVQCRGGYGMSMRPQGEVGGGDYFSNQDVTTEASVSQAIKELDNAKILMQGGLSVSGKQTVKVKLICPGD